MTEKADKRGKKVPESQKEKYVLFALTKILESLIIKMQENLDDLFRKGLKFCQEELQEHAQSINVK